MCLCSFQNNTSTWYSELILSCFPHQLMKFIKKNLSFFHKWNMNPHLSSYVSTSVLLFSEKLSKSQESGTSSAAHA